MFPNERELTATSILRALRDAEIDLDQLDGLADVLTMTDALGAVPVNAPSQVDTLCGDVTAGKIKPDQLAGRVHEVALREIDQGVYGRVRSAVSDRIAARTLGTLRTNLDEIHRQLDDRFTNAAARLAIAVDQLGGINDPGDALNAGREESWRAVQSATAELEVIATAVRRLPDLGWGTHGNAATWFVDVNEIDQVADLPKERPDDPLGRFVGWLRAGHRIDLADGPTKIKRDAHVVAVKNAVSNPFAGQKISAGAAHDANTFNPSGAPVNRM